MSDVRRYLAELGRRGGMKSRRSLDPETARRMVEIREARRAARRVAANRSVHATAPGGVTDTSLEAREFQDARLRQMTPAQKLAAAAALSRGVDALARAGVRMRHPHADADELDFQYAVLRLGPELADRVHEAVR